MEMNDSNDQLTDTGHCLTPTTVSGTFLELAQAGDLISVSQMFRKRANIAAQLEEIEQQLRSCNHPDALAEFVQWCKSHNKLFVTELNLRADSLEAQKLTLAAELAQIDEQLGQLNLHFEWSDLPVFISLVPAGAFNAAVALRFLIIEQHRGKSHQEIAAALDSTFRPGERPTKFFNDDWTERFGVTTFLEAYRHPECRGLVDKMFSSRRRRGP